MDTITGQVRDWAAQARKTSVGILATICGLLTIASLIFFFWDVRTSYHGWGKYAATIINTGDNGVLLAYAVSLLPTLVQQAWFVSKVTGLTFISQHGLFTALTVVAAVFDTCLDVYQLYIPEQGAASFIGAVVVAIFVYGVLSEALFSFFAPVTLVLVKNLFKDANWGFGLSEPQRTSSPRPRQSVPMPTRPSPGPSPEALKQREAMMRARSR